MIEPSANDRMLEKQVTDEILFQMRLEGLQPFEAMKRIELKYCLSMEGTERVYHEVMKAFEKEHPRY